MRARAILVAWVLAAQTIAPSLALAGTVRASCCCAVKDKQCHCPSCSKNRAIAEGHGVVVSCGFGSGHALVPLLQVAVPPASDSSPAMVLATPAPLFATAPPLVSREVPTPPPLQ